MVNLLHMHSFCPGDIRNSLYLVETTREEADNMGKKLDYLLGRSFKISKLKTLVNLAISRLAVLKNQRQVEYVIKEQNMLDVFLMIEAYCHLLIERITLFQNKFSVIVFDLKLKSWECPDELKEAYQA
ncbi:hypothetical protein CK203_023533 [Vitis vinifera]|uniref:Uncharacterized protein n=1 Tax=Vitis vinifera TaxID=29760 RepID=A0A438JBX0_VITVI|nr:hypothetical protein CK203_023533 [Vitis vinifera]